MQKKYIINDLYIIDYMILVNDILVDNFTLAPGNIIDEITNNLKTNINVGTVERIDNKCKLIVRYRLAGYTDLRKN